METSLEATSISGLEKQGFFPPAPPWKSNYKNVPETWCVIPEIRRERPVMI